jgi:integrase
LKLLARQKGSLPVINLEVPCGCGDFSTPVPTKCHSASHRERKFFVVDSKKRATEPPVEVRPACGPVASRARLQWGSPGDGHCPPSLAVRVRKLSRGQAAVRVTGEFVPQPTCSTIAGELTVMLWLGCGTPRPTRVAHRALPHAQIPEFMVDLRAQEGTAARALECAILCVSCSAEIRGMQWSELAGNVWVIPASRIKSGREHRIPLSAAASALIEYMRER